MTIKKIKIIARTIFLTLLIYLFIGLRPYLGHVNISNEWKSDFTTSSFSNQNIIPEKIRLVESPEEAFSHRLNLITNAEYQIILTTFTIHDGVTTDKIVGALLDAANRGVHIQILNDGASGKMSRDYLIALSSHNLIDVYIFTPINILKPHLFNRLMHDKYMIVDTQFLLLGGRNIGDKYFNPEGFDKRLTLDREVLIFNSNLDFSGSIVQTINYFEQKIQSEMVLLHNPTSREIEITAENLQKQFIEYYHLYRVDSPAEKFDPRKQMTEVRNITLIYDSPQVVRKEPVVGFTLYQLASESEKIIMQTPYIALTRRNQERFLELIYSRDVTLITNSLASSPNIAAFSAYYVDRDEYVQRGLKIYEFQSNTKSIHGKTFLFDGRITAIGSFNLNERSLRSDTETMLIIDSEEFHEIVIDAINNQKANSLRVNLDNVYEYDDYIDISEVGNFKSILFNIFGRVMRPFRFLF